jgi:hypothetical protein
MSIGRGSFDEWSDLDLDVVTASDVDAAVEGRLVGGPDALVLPTRPGEVDIVLQAAWLLDELRARLMECSPARED